MEANAGVALNMLLTDTTFSMESRNSTKPTSFVYTDEGGKLKINPDAIDVLGKIKEPIFVVSVCGLDHDGKDFILNQLLGRSSEFHVASTHQAGTEGIWMWDTSLKKTALDGTSYNILLLFNVGIQVFDQTETCTSQMFSLAILFSSLFMHNQDGVIERTKPDQVGGIVMTGPILAGITTSFLNALNSGEISSLQGTIIKVIKKLGIDISSEKNSSVLNYLVEDKMELLYKAFLFGVRSMTWPAKSLIHGITQSIKNLGLGLLKSGRDAQEAPRRKTGAVWSKKLTARFRKICVNLVKNNEIPSRGLQEQHYERLQKAFSHGKLSASQIRNKFQAMKREWREWKKSHSSEGSLAGQKAIFLDPKVIADYAIIFEEDDALFIEGSGDSEEDREKKDDGSLTASEMDCGSRSASGSKRKAAHDISTSSSFKLSRTMGIATTGPSVKNKYHDLEVDDAFLFYKLNSGRSEQDDIFLKAKSILYSNPIALQGYMTTADESKVSYLEYSVLLMFPSQAEVWHV